VRKLGKVQDGLQVNSGLFVFAFFFLFRFPLGFPVRPKTIAIVYYYILFPPHT
jgi:hypothetical protein